MVRVGGGSGVVYGYGVLWNSADQISVGVSVAREPAGGLFSGAGVLSAVRDALGSVLDLTQATTINKMTIAVMANKLKILECFTVSNVASSGGLGRKC